MGKYKFVKVERINPSENDHSVWYFSPDSIEQIKEHWRKYPASVIREGSRKVAHRIFENGKLGVSHATNEFEEAIQRIHPFTENFLISDMVQIENIAYNNRINDFVQGRTIYLTKGMPVVTIDTRFYHIIGEVYKDELTFPDEERPSITEVRYIQWDGGEHWYAKIGNLDIVDINNNQKWNTKEEARKAAEWYIEKNW